MLVPLALDRYRALGHAVEGTRIAARAGSLGRTTRVVDVRSVDSLRLTRSLSQRRAGLASLRASVGGPRALVLDAGHSDTVALAHRLLPALTGEAADGALPAASRGAARRAPMAELLRAAGAVALVAAIALVAGLEALVVVPLALAAAVAASALALAELRAWRFELSPAGVLVRSGYVTHAWGLAENGRIELVSLDERPLDRLLGLARVDVHTAGGVLELPPLMRGEALALLAELAERAGASGDDT